MGNVDAFLKSLLNFDKNNIPEACVDKVEKDYIKQPYFTPEAIRTKSAAAGGLCAWVANICKYFRIYQVPAPGTQHATPTTTAPLHAAVRVAQRGVWEGSEPLWVQVVAPKRAALAEANARLQGANQKLSTIRAKVAELRARVANLEENLMKVRSPACALCEGLSAKTLQQRGLSPCQSEDDHAVSKLTVAGCVYNSNSEPLLLFSMALSCAAERQERLRSPLPVSTSAALRQSHLQVLLQATQDKNAAVAQAERTSNKAKLAERLISGLAGEFRRWTKNIQEFAVAEGVLPSLVQLCSGFRVGGKLIERLCRQPCGGCVACCCVRQLCSSLYG